MSRVNELNVVGGANRPEQESKYVGFDGVKALDALRAAIAAGKTAWLEDDMDTLRHEWMGYRLVWIKEAS